MNLLLVIFIQSGLLAQPMPTERPFAGYAGPDLVIQETVMICNGERFVFTQVGRSITAIRTPWGFLREEDLTALQAATAAVMAYPDQISLLCSPDEFQIEFEGPATGEDPERSNAQIDFWFRGGRMVSAPDNDRGGASPVAGQR
jgi:hypothetical protein